MAWRFYEEVLSRNLFPSFDNTLVSQAKQMIVMTPVGYTFYFVILLHFNKHTHPCGISNPK